MNGYNSETCLHLLWLDRDVALSVTIASNVGWLSYFTETNILARPLGSFSNKINTQATIQDIT